LVQTLPLVNERRRWGMTPEHRASLKAHVELLRTQGALHSAVGLLGCCRQLLAEAADAVGEEFGLDPEAIEEAVGFTHLIDVLDEEMPRLASLALDPEELVGHGTAIVLLHQDGAEGEELATRLEALLARDLAEARKTSNPRKRIKLV
jgi:hypothetical protein